MGSKKLRRKDRVIVETGVLQFLQIIPATNYVTENLKNNEKRVIK